MSGFEMMAKQLLASLGVKPEELRDQLRKFLEGVKANLEHFDGRIKGLESSHNDLSREIRELRESIDALISVHIRDKEADNDGRKQPGPQGDGGSGEGGSGTDASGASGERGDTGAGDGNRDNATGTNADNAGDGSAGNQAA